MATSVTISPTLGHPVMYTQGGVYDIDNSGVGGDAIDLRRSLVGSACPQEGVLASGDWKVTATSGDMTVDVAADTGIAVVQGDSVTAEGLYTVAPHSDTITLTHDAASSSAPRLDQIILQVRNDESDGSGENDARCLILKGTATAGATLTNRTGAATLPDTAILLADVLVPANATSLSTSDLRDRRPWARGAYSRTVRTTNASSGSNYTVGSSSLTEVDATNLKPRIECTGVPVRVTLLASGLIAAKGDNGKLALSVDGSATIADGDATALEIVFQGPESGYAMNLCWSGIYMPTAGSHTFALAASTSGSLTLDASASVPLQWIIEELVRPDASNT